MEGGPKGTVGPQSMVVSVEGVTKEEALGHPTEHHERHNGKGECNAVSPQALHQHLGQGFGREEREDQEGRAHWNAEPGDEQEHQGRQHVPDGDGRKGLVTLENAVKLPEREVISFSPEVFPVAQVAQGDDDSHDGSRKQPKLPPLASLIGHQERTQRLDAVVSDDRVGGQRKSEEGKQRFQGVQVAVRKMPKVWQSTNEMRL